MPRREPTTTIDVVGNLDLRPEQAVGDYRASRQQDKYFVKPPNWDSAGDSIELLYIQNLRENEAMRELQQEMLQNAKRQSQVSSQRTRKMYKLQERLRKRFIEVNSFLKDCADKKRAADKVIQQERALHVELNRGIDSFKSSIAELKAFRTDLQATVSEFQPYECVLEDIVKVSDIFVSPKDCIERCDALMLAQVEISQVQSHKIEEIEQMRQRMLQVTSKAALTVLGLRNDLGRLERSYNQARQTCLQWETILSSCKDVIANNNLDKERSIDCLVTLYKMLCKRRDIKPSLRTYEMPLILDFIKRELSLWNDVIREIEAAPKANKSDAADLGGALC
ncbi:cilia- and flagella-associated protein 73-like [Drosophila subobscura]|uniref:cilia- and flagella-associated protein 73-like n=1 Tax=Drosophila subobscura TaxID=7241 RepID=UPI00155ADD75|nr:cilia- and flagella-associated protein 73-like [Drosophila subobscura]